MNAPLGQMDVASQLPGINVKKGRDRRAIEPWLWTGFIGVFVLVVILGGWAHFAKIRGAVVAPGRIEVESKPKTIQHLDGGIVGEILVKNGDHVKAGQVLLRLDPTSKDANKTIIEKRLFEAQAQVDRLRAERDGLSEIDWSSLLRDNLKRPDVQSIMTGQEKLFTARKKSSDGQQEQLRQRIRQSEDQIAGLKNLIASKKKQRDLITQELAGLRKLLVKGYVSKTRVLALEREQARLSGEISSHQADIARMKSVIGETRIQILQIEKDEMSEVLAELRKYESEVNDLKEQLVTASDQLERVDIVSPVDGIVHNMEVTTIGGVVAPGAPIMQIVPLNDRLIIEAQIRPEDVDQIYEGQPAEINLSAFSRRTTPRLMGKVIGHSPDSIVDKMTGISYFSVRIEIPPEEMKLIEGLTLIPGMPAECYIQTQERTVLSYLLKPFKDQLGRAFREE